MLVIIQAAAGSGSAPLPSRNAAICGWMPLPGLVSMSSAAGARISAAAPMVRPGR
jgi:hypothetical protein